MLKEIIFEVGILILINFFAHYFYYKISRKNRNLLLWCGTAIISSIITSSLYIFFKFKLLLPYQLIYYGIVLGSFIVHYTLNIDLYSRWVSGKNIRLNFINSLFLEIGAINIWYFLLVW